MRSPPAPEAETVQEDVDAAVEVVNGYWADHWAELFTGSYRPPRVLGAYDGAARDVPACGGQALVDDNAVYRGVNDYVARDVDLMSAGAPPSSAGWPGNSSRWPPSCGPPSCGPTA